ncbi:MAG: hypothetical protein AAGI14_00065 [Pseudomonadota bacterium]
MTKVDPTIFLIVGLSVSAFVWLLTVQLRGFCVKALSIAAQAKFPKMAAGEIKQASQATALDTAIEGDLGQVQGWLVETYPQAVGQLRLAVKLRFVGPVLILAVVVIWRFVLGGGQ